MPGPIVPPAGLFRYPANDSSAAAFALTAGFKATADAAPNNIFPIKGQGVHVYFGGAGDDNDAYNYRIWLVRSTYAADGKTQTGLEYEFFGSGTATMSTAAFIGGGGALGTGRIADTLTFTLATDATTPKGPATVLNTALGAASPAAYSPADNTPACLVIPHLGWPEGIIIEFDMTTGDPTGAFALIAHL